MSNKSVPSYYSLLYSKRQISKRVHALGREIEEWLDSICSASSKPAVAVCVLRGGMVFFADLLRSISLPLELQTIAASSYSSLTNLQLDREVQVLEFSFDIRDRPVLLVDDICDTGNTLSVLVDKMKSGGASQVKTAVMVERSRNAGIKPDWSGFEFSGTEWMVGYGMEDGNKFANLSDIYKIVR